MQYTRHFTHALLVVLAGLALGCSCNKADAAAKKPLTKEQKTEPEKNPDRNCGEYRTADVEQEDDVNKFFRQGFVPHKRVLEQKVSDGREFYVWILKKECDEPEQK